MKVESHTISQPEAILVEDLPEKLRVRATSTPLARLPLLPFLLLGMCRNALMVFQIFFFSVGRPCLLVAPCGQ